MSPRSADVSSLALLASNYSRLLWHSRFNSKWHTKTSFLVLSLLVSRSSYFCSLLCSPSAHLGLRALLRPPSYLVSRRRSPSSRFSSINRSASLLRVRPFCRSQHFLGRSPYGGDSWSKRRVLFTNRTHLTLAEPIQPVCRACLDLYTATICPNYGLSMTYLSVSTQSDA